MVQGGNPAANTEDFNAPPYDKGQRFLFVKALLHKGILEMHLRKRNLSLHSDTKVRVRW